MARRGVTVQAAFKVVEADRRVWVWLKVDVDVDVDIDIVLWTVLFRIDQMRLARNINVCL